MTSLLAKSLLCGGALAVVAALAPMSGTHAQIPSDDPGPAPVKNGD